MRYIAWIVTIPFALLLLSFAISNREMATLGLWPLPFRIDAPLYLVALLPLLFGMLIGALALWFGRFASGFRMRRLESRLAATQKDLEGMKARQKTGGSAFANRNAADAARPALPTSQTR
ncbi:putative integral membrane protein [Inquilinus ginsengisoli]|uniref:Integral membrane protein n=1 Tax=Inquilinus ginsengisoli TaxID=363840 RepID=A0ABU1JSB8_9PROT|nr:lipopolysaccharide assembly protein LapA domain-containing protein [Inquilinus ginsengisoli]MDR6291508.1 putative integral membrane protein [Inquilinus ginsengisoli]